MRSCIFLVWLNTTPRVSRIHASNLDRFKSQTYFKFLQNLINKAEMNLIKYQAFNYIGHLQVFNVIFLMVFLHDLCTRWRRLQQHLHKYHSQFIYPSILSFDFFQGWFPIMIQKIWIKQISNTSTLNKFIWGALKNLTGIKFHTELNASVLEIKFTWRFWKILNLAEEKVN